MSTTQSDWNNYQSNNANANYIGKERVGEEWVSCRLCMDHQYLIVHMEWVMGRIIPKDFHVPDYCIKSYDRGMGVQIDQHKLFVPCDCHSGYKEKVGKKTDGKSLPIFKFDYYFSMPARKHHYGRMIMDYRQMLMEFRRDEIEETKNENFQSLKDSIMGLMNIKKMPYAKE